MNKTKFLALVSVLAIVLVGLVIYNDKTQRNAPKTPTTELPPISNTLREVRLDAGLRFGLLWTMEYATPSIPHQYTYYTGNRSGIYKEETIATNTPDGLDDFISSYSNRLIVEFGKEKAATWSDEYFSDFPYFSRCLKSDILLCTKLEHNNWEIYKINANLTTPRKQYIYLAGKILDDQVVIFEYRAEHSDSTEDRFLSILDTVSLIPPTVTPPLTLDLLKSNPEWNPTERVEGMWRVEDGVVELEVKDYPYYTEEKIWPTVGLSHSKYVIKYLDTITSIEACKQYGLYGKTPGGYLLRYICLEAHPSLYNELIILSGDTGEVLHKFKLEEGWSFVHSLYEMEGFGFGFGMYPDRITASIYIYKWNFSHEIPSIERRGYLNYRLNIQTGEITRAE